MYLIDTYKAELPSIYREYIISTSGPLADHT